MQSFDVRGPHSHGLFFLCLVAIEFWNERRSVGVFAQTGGAQLSVMRTRIFGAPSSLSGHQKDSVDPLRPEALRYSDS